MTTPMQRTGVLGGGALGLAAALRLAQAGRRVTLIEREPQLGGLASGFSVGPNYLEKFYHHIFRTDTTKELIQIMYDSHFRNLHHKREKHLTAKNA